MDVVWQVTDSKILQEYITQEGHKLEIAPKPPMAVTNAVSWRSEGLKYRKNEVFLDVVESVNLLVSASGNVLRSEIVGAIKMRVYLSGMPELRLGLNDKVRSMAFCPKLLSCYCDCEGVSIRVSRLRSLTSSLQYILAWAQHVFSCLAKKL